DRLETLLLTPAEILDATVGTRDDVAVQKALLLGARKQALSLTKGATSDSRAFLYAIGARITVQESAIDIEFSRAGLNAILGVTPRASLASPDDERLRISAA